MVPLSSGEVMANEHQVGPQLNRVLKAIGDRRNDALSQSDLDSVVREFPLRLD
jgi:hypothetical protein